MAKIGQASIDERGRTSGGKAGNQSGRELNIRDWYRGGWTHVIRARDPAAREKIAAACEAAVANRSIGYDQGQRTTLYDEAKKAGWDVSKISTPCETDCSALVAVCVNAAGIPADKSGYPRRMPQGYLATGAFDVLTGAKYTKESGQLLRGDILVKKGHAAIVVEADARQARPAYAVGGAYTTQVNLNVREKAAASSKKLMMLARGAKVRCLALSDNGGDAWMRTDYGWLAAYYKGKAYVK